MTHKIKQDNEHLISDQRRHAHYWAFDEGLTETLVTGETIRATLKRLGVGWRRAKQWITSPDPAYAAKKTRETG